MEDEQKLRGDDREKLRRQVVESLDNALANGHTDFLHTGSQKILEDMVECDSEIERMVNSGEVSEFNVRRAIVSWQLRRRVNIQTTEEAYLRTNLDALRLEDAGLVIERYFENKAWQVSVNITGGRAVELSGSTASDKTRDWDFLVLTEEVEGAMAGLTQAGFTIEGGDHYKDILDKNQFVSLRRGLVNIILTGDIEFADNHRLATRLSQRLGLTCRDHRKMLFRAILYGETPQ